MAELATAVPAPVTLDVTGAGSATVSYYRTEQGTRRLDIRMSVALPDDEHAAANRLAAVVTHLRTLLGPARRNPGRAA